LAFAGRVACALRGWGAVVVLIPVLVLGWITEAGAVELVTGPEVRAGGDRATVAWTTDVPAGGRVQWGVEPGKLNQRAQGPVGTNHAVEIGGLKPGTRYHFTVGTARYPLATNQFTTAGGSSAPGDVTVPAASAVAPGPGIGAGGGRASPAAQPQAPPTSRTWGSMRTLQDHFDRHGADFGSKDPDDYARQAWLFLQRARREGLPAKRDADGVLRVYDPATREFAAYNRDGTTRTYFKPGRRDYFRDQPGRAVNLREER
jgi:hypothetical protein